MVTAEVPTPYGYVYRSPDGNGLTRLISVLRPGGDVLHSPCLAYAVRHPRAGTMLIDTGLHADAAKSIRSDFGPAMGLLFRSLRPADEPFDEQLSALGLAPAAIAHVLMTHLHVDHTSGMRLLPNAEFSCAREEWQATRGRFAAGRGYIRHHLPPESRMRLLDFDRDGVPHGPFAKTIDLLGDGTVCLISTPGHSAGHMSVLLRRAGGGQVLVVGDAAYTQRNIREEILPLLTVDDDAAVRSVREIKAFAESEPEAVLVPSHDPSAWHQLS